MDTPNQTQHQEPWYAWLFRQVVEKPAAVMAVIGWVAAAYIYADLRDFIESSTSTMQGLTERIELNNQEQRLKLDEVIQNTRDLEYWHKQDATRKENAGK